MSSIPIYLKQASGKARAEYEREQYLANLRRQSKLANQALETNLRQSKMKKLGIPAIKPMELKEFTSAEELYQNQPAQLKTGLENAKKLLPLGDDASTFVQTLGRQPIGPNGNSELQLFNRYFKRFEKNISDSVDVKSITPQYLKTLWDNWAHVVPYFEYPAADQPLDFRDPASRLISQQNLFNQGEVLKTRIARLTGINATRKVQLENKIDDAVLAINKAALDDIQRQLDVGSFVTTGTITTAPPPSTIKKPRVKAKVPEDEKQYVEALDNIFGSKVSPRNYLASIHDKLTRVSNSNIWKVVDQLLTLARSTFDEHEAKIDVDTSWQKAIRVTVAMAELAYAGVTQGYPFDKLTTIEKVFRDYIKTVYDPDDVVAATERVIDDYLHSLSGPTLTSLTSSASSSAATAPSTAPSGGPSPLVLPSSFAAVVSGPPPVTPIKPPGGRGIKKGSKREAQILAGEIAAGNNNPKIKKKLFKLIH
jgi:hypothetical protein